MRESFISNRRVHYIGGFDPRGIRFYHQLYAKEAAKQTLHNRLQLEVGGRSRLNHHFGSWTITGNCAQGVVNTDYHFLGWDDIVRQQWPTSLPRLVAKSLPAYLDYLLSDGFGKVRQRSKSAFLTGTLPLGYLALLGLCSGALFAATEHWVGASTGSALAGCTAGFALAAALWFSGVKQAANLGLLWLLRTYVFIHRWSTGQQPELEHRVDAMAEHILECHRKNPAQETLVIGHSVGTLLAVCVAARLLEKTAANSSEQNLAGIHILTLGQCLPLLSLMPGADSFRSRICSLGTQTHLRWTDVSAKADPLCFFRTNPLHLAGGDGHGPVLKNASFFQMFQPHSYKNIRWNKLRLHFQYLMASERPSDYDYFSITAGPKRLESHMPDSH